MLAFFCGHMDIYFYVFILANLLTYKIVFEHSRKTTQNVVKQTISSKYLEQVYLRFPYLSLTLSNAIRITSIFVGEMFPPFEARIRKMKQIHHSFFSVFL